MVALVVTAIFVQGWLKANADQVETEWEADQARLTGEIESLQSQLDALDSQIAAIDQEIESEKTRIAKIDSDREALLADIQAEEERAGLRSVTGQGLTIRIEEPDRPYVQGDTTAFLVYNPEYILSLISEINQADVKGIAVNGVRFTNYSSLKRSQGCLTMDDQLMCQGDGGELKTVVLQVVGPTDEIMKRIDFQGSTLGYLRDSIGLIITLETGTVELPKADRLPEPVHAQPME